MPRDPKPMQPCVVEWEDAHVDAGVQYDSLQGALDAYRPTIRKSIGFWIGRAHHASHACVVIATDDDRSPDEPNSVGGPSYIPVGMVRSVTVLAKIICRPKPRKR